MDYFLTLLHLENWNVVITVIARLVGSALCGGLIGLERGRHGRAAGLRTHILVCVGAAITSLTGIYLVDELGYGTDIARLSAQVISGIGFLGAGTILIRNNSIITGLTTAAGMWATAAIGVAMGFGFYIGSVTATFISIFSFSLLSRLEAKRRKEIYSYIELANIRETESVIDALRNLDDPVLYYEVIPAKSGHSEHVGIHCRMSNEKQLERLREKTQENDVAMMIRVG